MKRVYTFEIVVEDDCRPSPYSCRRIVEELKSAPMAAGVKITKVQLKKEEKK